MTKEDRAIDVEANFYACIATLDSLVRFFEEGKIDPAIYKRQLQSLFRDIFKFQNMLREQGIDVQAFIEKERLKEQFPLAIQRLETPTLEGKGPTEILESPITVAFKAAEIVADLITIIDAAKLETVASAKMLVPLLEDALILLEAFPGLNKDYWVLKNMKQWKEYLSNLPPDKILPPDEVKKLEFEAVRWLNDFRGRLKTLK